MNHARFKDYTLFFLIILIILNSSFIWSDSLNWDLPDEIKSMLNEDTRQIFLLFGGKYPSTCPGGSALFKSRQNPNLLIVTSPDFKSVDIENLRRSYDIKGKIERGSEKLLPFLKQIADYLEIKIWKNEEMGATIENWHNDFIIELENRKPVRMGLIVGALKPYPEELP